MPRGAEFRKLRDLGAHPQRRATRPQENRHPEILEKNTEAIMNYYELMEPLVLPLIENFHADFTRHD